MFILYVKSLVAVLRFDYPSHFHRLSILLCTINMDQLPDNPININYTTIIKQRQPAKKQLHQQIP